MMKNNYSFSVSPLVDDNNTLHQEPIYDRNGNLIRYLSSFRCSQIDNITKQFESFNILVDLDINLYNTDINYKNTLYSRLISYDRIKKIINQYNGYAGGLYWNESTHEYEKYIDARILDSINYQKHLEDEKTKESSKFEERRKNFLHEIHDDTYVKPNHATVLSQENHTINSPSNER